MKILIITLFVFGMLLAGCTFLQGKVQETKTENKTQQDQIMNKSITNQNKTITANENLTNSLEKNTSTEILTNETIPPPSSQGPKNYTLKLGETIAIGDKTYQFCDYSHHSKVAVTKIAFCKSESEATDFYALISQNVSVGNYTVLVTKLVPRDNTIGIPEVAYIELILSQKN